MDPYEKEDFSKKDLGSTNMVDRFLQIHNQGYSRELSLPESKNLILEDGWHNLRNDITGSIGFEFKVKVNQIVSHLGLWDDHDREIPIRDARGIPTEFGSDKPSREGDRPRSIRSEHWIKLWEFNDSSFKEIGAVLIGPEKQGQLEGEFRYLELKSPINLYSQSHYMLTMSTRAGDNDYFHDHVAFDGLSPLVSPMVSVIKNVMLRENYPDQTFSIPSFADLHSDYSKFRIPVGPTLRFQ